MATVVTGLSQNGEIGSLHAALVEAGIPTDRLEVVRPEDSASGVSRGLAGSELMTGGGQGTGVPGINNMRGSRPFFRNESLADRLGDFEIPESELDNYVEALERGRSLVAFFANVENIERVEALFRENGLLNVRRF